MIRSLLFIPGSNEKLLAKGPGSDADALIYDLEDAVSPDQKDVARTMVRDALLGNHATEGDASLQNHAAEGDAHRSHIRIVRINSIETEYWKEDLREVLKGAPDMIMLPKASQPEDIATLLDELSKIEENSNEAVGIIPLIETALGLENAYRIASCSPRIKGMLLGAEDLTADLHCKRTKEGREIFYARSRMVACGRAAGVEIFDTPFTDTRDEEGIKSDAELAKSLGFTGKAAITPRHLETINAAFSPTAEDIEYARAVLAAIEEAEREGRGVIALNGKMIDAPVVERARQVLDAAQAIGLA